jgi:hypothetical protein
MWCPSFQSSEDNFSRWSQKKGQWFKPTQKFCFIRAAALQEDWVGNGAGDNAGMILKPDGCNLASRGWKQNRV